MSDTQSFIPPQNDPPALGRYEPEPEGVRGVAALAVGSRPGEERAAGESPGFSSWAAVAAFTAVAGILHFSYLGRPCLWEDEALTYRRVCGTFGQLFETLHTSGFAPLHFLIEWTIGRFLSLSPAVLRLFPALCGTLMVPAMYVLRPG